MEAAPLEGGGVRNIILPREEELVGVLLLPLANASLFALSSANRFDDDDDAPAGDFFVAMEEDDDNDDRVILRAALP